MRASLGLVLGLGLWGLGLLRVTWGYLGLKLGLGLGLKLGLGLVVI